MYDLIVIGGGAAGIAAAITAASNNKRVAIIEKNKKLGRKIYSTGNGKCNITNTYFNFSEKYNSESRDYVSFLTKVMGDMPYKSVCEYLSLLGISVYDNDSYVYPNSNQASSVVWAMQDKLIELGVLIKLSETVENVNFNNNIFNIKTNLNTYKSKNVLLACGGASYSSIGGTFSGYEIAESLGHNIVEVSQALCAVTTNEKVEDISGVRIKAVASLYEEENGNKSFVYKEKGELQITAGGLSGIMIFNLSSRINQIIRRNNTPIIEFDFIDGIDHERFNNGFMNSKNRTVLGFVNSFINDKLASYILINRNINPKMKIMDMSVEDMDVVFSALRSYSFTVNSLVDIDMGQVCHGGVDIRQIDGATMMSNIVKGLFFAGEMIDIDGMCGGYNLSFAILSGIKAGECIYD